MTKFCLHYELCAHVLPSARARYIKEAPNSMFYKKKCFSDKHQELDLPSQVHVEEDEEEVEEEENEQSLRSNRGNDVLEEEEECPETKQDELDTEAVNYSTTSVCPRLMEKIDAAKDVSDHTTFGSSDIPPMGVWTDHQPELEKVGAPREKCGAFFAFEVKQAKT